MIDSLGYRRPRQAEPAVKKISPSFTLAPSGARLLSVLGDHTPSELPYVLQAAASAPRHDARPSVGDYPDRAGPSLPWRPARPSRVSPQGPR